MYVGMYVWMYGCMDVSLFIRIYVHVRANTLVFICPIHPPMRPDTCHICRWWRTWGLQAIEPLYCIERVGVLGGRGEG